MKRSARNVLRLEDCWLYAVASRADLARRLSTKGTKITVRDLEKLSRDSDNFRLFTIRSNDKSREVQEPKSRLQRAHTRIHKLLSRIETPAYLHSAIRGRSYLTNARAHDPGAPTIKIDVKKFFPSVPRVAVFCFFAETLKCRSDVAGLLADLMTFDARLPTGSSASPIIAYYAFKPMFDEIAQFAQSWGLTMTCYVDDMTLSGKNANGAAVYEVHKLIAKYGLKSHKMRVFSGTQPKIITGVCNVPGGQRVPNKLQMNIRKGFDDLSTAETPEESAKISGALLGRMEAAGQIDPVFRDRARTLRAHLKQRRSESSPSQR